jgi:nucleoside-diphosphate-sugar epimerase
MRPNDGRVMPAFCSQALAGEPLTVFGDGLQTRSFCYVSDLVEGISRLMESDLTTPCNVGNPHEMTMLQLAEYINRFTGNKAGIVHRPLPKDDPTRRRPDITLARTRLGWEPQVDFEEGVSRTVAYFRSL